MIENLYLFYFLDEKKAEASAITFYGNESRSGHFDSRSHQCGHNCSFYFIGKPNDVIHLTLLNYHLRYVLISGKNFISHNTIITLIMKIIIKYYY